LALALTRSQEEGDDLVQAGLERALSKTHLWQDGTRLDSWVFRIMQNIWYDQLRARKAQGHGVDPDVLETMPGEDVERQLEARSEVSRTRAALARLSEDQRAVVALVLIDGVSYRDAAQILEVPIGTIMSRLARARTALFADVFGANAQSRDM